MAKDAEFYINIPEMLDLKCGQIERSAHDKWVGWYLQKAELVLSEQREVNGDDREAVLVSLMNYIATTPPAMRCSCKKGVEVVKAGQHWGQATPSLSSFARRWS